MNINLNDITTQVRRDILRMVHQELLTNYGEIGGIWFDGEWDQMAWNGKRFGEKMQDFKLGI